MSTAPEIARVWFITGATSGFGLALARAVLARGERAVITGRRADRLQAIAAPHGERALPIPLDVTDGAAREAAVASALARFGRIDVLANIAGRGSLGAVEEFSPAQLREQMDVNFFAAAELARSVLPAMRAQRSGHILNLTSIGGLVSIGGFGAYCASKFALEAWSEALRDEVAALGIRVTIVEPGAFRTEFAGDANMRPAHPMAVYRPVVAPVEDYLYGGAATHLGDPARAAALMIEAVESDTPPLRLMMGADAFGLWDTVIAARQADLAAWRERGLATAFEDAAPRPIGG
ncbi:MAG: oxidoreductase [Steroidobacteraceae bacterium]|jgi:NAD(P)-dependent dehydrogenase (short-subunit alcohol dehydrogenase family)|nr:oxidoreductase [Steroidobacteraceae bacterium]